MEPEDPRGAYRVWLGENCPQGRDKVHWDMVNIQRPDWGGGEIVLDGDVIRKDGRFVDGPLAALNPEHLV